MDFAGSRHGGLPEERSGGDNGLDILRSWRSLRFWNWIGLVNSAAGFEAQSRESLLRSCRGDESGWGQGEHRCFQEESTAAR
jgi:hypothetical protein